MNKEVIINNYISMYNFKSDDWSIKQIKETLKPLLGEEVGIRAEYEKDVFINEVTSKASEVKKLSKIYVTYTELNGSITTKTYIID